MLQKPVPSHPITTLSSFEVYYRFNLTEHLAITPDFQFVIHPSLNEAVDNMTYFGIQGRITI